MRLLTIYVGDGENNLLDRLQRYSETYKYQPISKCVRELLYMGLSDWESRKGIDST